NHWVHSYPKMGVYEQDIEGTWGWNCHQFLPSMEFYGDHGNYNVTIDAPSSYVIGASGCLNKEEIAEDRTLHTYIAEDVIDFAWVASPFLEVQEDQWEHVEIRYLYPSSHEGLKKRLIGAAKNALTYMKEHVGEYPYTTLTIIDPPIYGLRSGFMEYPTYITGGAFHCWPEEVRSIESLIIHEFAHQYFMQILASNEKEEPWLDEGFVTFYEDCIMEDAYGSEASLSGAWGYNVPNSAFTRNEYASLPNPRVSPIAVPSWEINDAYKGIIYSKTATVLQTIKEHLGEDKFDEMMKSYFELNKFSHPRRENFINILRTAFEKSDSHLSENLEEFINQSLDGTQVCDYTVTNISNNQAKDGTGWFSNNNDFEFKESNTSNEYFSRIRLERKGDFIIPVEVKLTWANGDTEELIWDGRETVKYLVRTGKEKIISAEIDPRFLVRLDIDRNNNSFTLEPNSMGIWKYALRSLSWVQNALQATNVLM
ncbi:MAG: aminopeptidase N, partial [Saprospiraceae bacterium]